MLARRGIGDFTENGEGVRAGGGGDISRAAMESFVGKESESKGFFGVFWNAELRRGKDLDVFQSSGELGEEKWIAGAAAGNDELLDLGIGKDEPVQRVDDGESAENCCGTDEVGGLGAMPFAKSENFFQVRMAVVFAASGFGRSKL